MPVFIYGLVYRKANRKSQHFSPFSNVVSLLGGQVQSFAFL